MSQHLAGLLLGAATIIFFAAMAAALGFLVRAQWARRPDGSRRPPPPTGRFELWPTPGSITRAGRPYERMARRALLLALFALTVALVIRSMV
jgi:hypothetical protein